MSTFLEGALGRGKGNRSAGHHLPRVLRIVGDPHRLEVRQHADDRLSRLKSRLLVHNARLVHSVRPMGGNLADPIAGCGQLRADDPIRRGGTASGDRGRSSGLRLCRSFDYPRGPPIEVRWPCRCAVALSAGEAR